MSQTSPRLSDSAVYFQFPGPENATGLHCPAFVCRGNCLWRTTSSRISASRTGSTAKCLQPSKRSIRQVYAYVTICYMTYNLSPDPLKNLRDSSCSEPCVTHEGQGFLGWILTDPNTFSSASELVPRGVAPSCKERACKQSTYGTLTTYPGQTLRGKTEWLSELLVKLHTVSKL